ncbi:MAG: hypothetical protein KatS3mg023_2931 [Armatimonadota bacterium]|nr:MAG: hypothetical protein KatS3mg023_2931 [Armatimonadota bacterium]
MRARILTTLAGLGLMLALGGCGMFLSGAQPMTPPSISNLQIEPSRMRFTGGQATVNVEVRDDNGVRAVTLVLVAPDDSRSSLAMDSVGQDVYRATITLPPNLTGNARQYQVSIEAEDIFGVRAQSSPMTLEVEALALPPGEPPI